MSLWRHCDGKTGIFCAAVLADPVTVPFPDTQIEKIGTKYLQIWFPEIQNALLAESHALQLAKALNRRHDMPLTETIEVDGAQHYSFLAPFPDAIIDSLPSHLTKDSIGFDRIAFQREFADRVAGFLSNKLDQCAKGNG